MIRLLLFSRAIESTRGKMADLVTEDEKDVCVIVRQTFQKVCLPSQLPSVHTKCIALMDGCPRMESKGTGYIKHYDEALHDYEYLWVEIDLMDSQYPLRGTS